MSPTYTRELLIPMPTCNNIYIYIAPWYLFGPFTFSPSRGYALLKQCWVSVVGGWPTLIHQWANVSSTGCERKVPLSSSQQTRYIDPMVGQCWPALHDVSPTLTQHWFNISWTLGYLYYWSIHRSFYTRFYRVMISNWSWYDFFLKCRVTECNLSNQNFGAAGSTIIQSDLSAYIITDCANL